MAQPRGGEGFVQDRGDGGGMRSLRWQKGDFRCLALDDALGLTKSLN